MQRQEKLARSLSEISIILQNFLWAFLYIAVSGVILFFVALIYGFATGQLAGLPSAEFETVLYELLFSPYLASIASVISAFLWIPLLVRKTRKEKALGNGFVFYDNLKPQKDVLKNVVFFIAATAVSNIWVYFLAFLGNKGVGSIGDKIGEYQALIELTLGNTVPIWLLLLGTGFLIPIVEELLFRGLILGRLRKVYSEKTAVVISAFMFGVAHMNSIQGSYAFIMGLALGIVYVRTRSIGFAMVCHIVYNFIGGILPSILGENVGFIVYIYIVQVVVLLTYLFLLFYRKLKKEPLT